MRKPALVALAVLVAAGTAPAAEPEDVCSDYDDSTLQGWYAIAATATIAVPGPDGSPYMRCRDLASSTETSAIYAPAAYLGDWTGYHALEFDFILHDEGWPGEAHPLSPVLHLKASPFENVGERAVFFIDWPVTDPDGNFPGWHHIIAPLTLTSGPDLPSNEFGHWVIPIPIVDPVTDWNSLLADVQMFRFIADIAGAPTQYEDFGLDNVCLRTTGPVSAEPETWARVKAAYR